MKIFKLLFLSYSLVIGLNLFAQDNVYHSTVLDMNFKISKNSEIKKLELENGQLGEIFIVFNNMKDLKYTITIIKKKDDVNFNKLTERKDYKNAFFKECNCDLLSETFERLNNFMIYRLKIKMKSTNGDIHGYSDSFYYKDYLYSFTFMSNSLDKFKKYTNDYNVFLTLIDEIL